MVFELFQKLHLQICASQCMMSLIIPLPFVLLNQESVERKEKIQKSEYLENKKSFLHEIIFFPTVFKGLSFGEKIKIWWKIAGHKLQCFNNLIFSFLFFFCFYLFLLFPILFKSFDLLFILLFIFFSFMYSIFSFFCLNFFFTFCYYQINIFEF